MVKEKKITIVHPIPNYKQVNTKKGVSQYAEYLSNRGNEVELIVYQNRQQDSESINIKGVNVRIIYTSGIWKIFSIIPILLSSQNDVFITQFFGKKDLVWAPICWIKGIRYCIIADYTPHQNKIPREIYYKTKFKLCILSLFTHVFFVRTTDSREELSAICSKMKTKLHTLPSGIADEYFEIENKTDKPNIIIYVGRLIEDKNVKVLLRAFNEIKNDYGSWELHIAGTGPKDYNIDNNEQIVFRGFLDGRELLDLYAQADILCLPSLHESFSNVLVEAAATETAIISTDVGIAPELLEDAGLLIDKNSVVDTSNKLREYMENADKREKDAVKLRRKAKKFKLSSLASDLEGKIQ